MKATWTVTHGDGSINGAVIIKILSLQPPPSLPLRNSTTGPIGAVKTMTGLLGMSKMTSPMFLLTVECVEGRGGP